MEPTTPAVNTPADSNGAATAEITTAAPLTDTKPAKRWGTKPSKAAKAHKAARAPHYRETTVKKIEYIQEIVAKDPSISINRAKKMVQAKFKSSIEDGIASKTVRDCKAGLSPKDLLAAKGKTIAGKLATKPATTTGKRRGPKPGWKQKLAGKAQPSTGRDAWAIRNGKGQFFTCDNQADMTAEVNNLLDKGASINDIVVFKQHPLNLKVSVVGA